MFYAGLLIATVFLFGVCLGVDPCSPDGHMKIPNIGFRFVNYRLSETDILFHDNQLPSGWYYVGDVTMPEHPPDDIFTCGTKFPVWLNGKHPVAFEEPETIAACQLGIVEDCEVEYNVRVQRCETFYVYFLDKTQSSNVGYCFGEGKKGEAPTFVPGKPTVYPNIDVVEGRNNRTVSSAFFQCNFTKSEDNLFYVVSWFVNQNQVYVTSYNRSVDSAALRLTEEDFKTYGITLGDNIACSVRAFNEIDSPPGKSSQLSDDYFAGIRVLTPSVEFNFDEKEKIKRSIRLQPTVPIGCKGSSCNLRLLSYVPDTFATCTGLSFEQGSCGVALHSANYSELVSIPLKAEDTGKYSLSGSYEVFLRVENTNENEIWGNYTLDPIKVTIKDTRERQVYEGTRCFSRNDPHMQTFDKRRYDNHQEGEFILYRNSKYNTEVQAKYYNCGSRGSRPIKCNCGIAVKAGQDLFEVNVCEGVFIGYKFCADKTLKVKSNGEWKYKIFFAYGTYVDISIAPRGGLMSLNADIIPSSNDMGNVVFGLCGDLDGDRHNDFHYRPGEGDNKPNLNIATSWDFNNQPKDFINVWKVRSKAENLFSPDVDKESFIPWIFKVCVCTNKTVADTSGSSQVSNSIPCTSNGVASCTKGKPMGNHTCSVLKSRLRRSVKRNPVIPIVYVESSRIQKREATLTNMTEDQAKQYCQEQIGSSTVFSLCSKVPSVNPNSSLEMCTGDIMLSGTTEWTRGTGEAMQDSCLSELRRNTTLRETSGNKTSIAEEIEDLACPNNCSSTGVCNKGECSCAAGYGGSDCSIDITKGPTISGLLDHGMCDEKDMPCDHAYVFGSIFTDSKNLTCRLEEFSISANGSRQKSQVHFIDAEFESLVEVMCPLSHTRRKRSAPTDTDLFVTGYTISISNGGNLFEKGADLFIYDSTCQLAQNVSNTIHFTLKDGFCFIDNRCVPQGGINPTDKCFNCDEQSSTKNWTPVNTDGCVNDQSVSQNVAPHDDGSSNYLWIIGVVAGVLVGVVIGVVVVIKLTKNRGKRVSDSSLFERPSPNPQPGSTQG